MRESYLEVCQAHDVVSDVLEPLGEDGGVITVYYSSTGTVQTADLEGVRPQLVGTKNVPRNVGHHQRHWKQNDTNNIQPKTNNAQSSIL